MDLKIDKVFEEYLVKIDLDCTSRIGFAMISGNLYRDPPKICPELISSFNIDEFDCTGGLINLWTFYLRIRLFTFQNL